MEFVEAIKIENRICNCYFNDYKCGKCPLDKTNNGKDLHCNKFINAYPKEAEEIIMKWAEEHPVKTNRQVFEEVLKEKFGDTFDMPRLMGRLNTCQIYRNSCPDVDDCFECSQKKFWDEEYQEVEKDAVSN